MIRPEHVELRADGLRGRVTESVYAGSELRLVVTLGSGSTLVMRIASGQAVPVIGDEVTLGWPPERARLLFS